MTIQIVVLNTNTSNSSDGSFLVSGVFWLAASGNYIPAPNFKSQVPFIDNADLQSLQVGTIVEQYFTTGQYPSGTSWASVQTDLQAQYSAAQASLTGSVSPLVNVVGNIYDSSNGWQTTNPFTPFSSLIATGTLNALNSTVQVSMYQYNSVGVQIAAGTFIGVIVAETSFDNGVTWNQTYFAQVGSGNKNAVLVYGSANTAGAYTIVMNGGVGLARLRAFSWTSGSCAITLRASNIFDESLDMDLASPASALPPSASIIGGSVTTAAPTYTTGTANFASLTTAGALRVDGSGITQPVSGTVAVSGTSSNNITQVGGVAVAATAKGTQATNAVGVQNLKDAGRVSFAAAALAATGVTTEALLSLTPVRTVTAGGASTSLTVTSGKTLRITGISVTVRATAASVQSVVCRVRVNNTTVTATSQMIFTVGSSTLAATSGSCNNETFVIPDGFEISGTTQIGITQLASSTSCTVDVTLIGFEY